METRMSTRLKVNINDDTEQVLRQYEAEGQSATETIRKAVDVFDYFDAAQSEGKEIRIVRRRSWRRPFKAKTYTVVTLVPPRPA